jgi:hypothetical protein
MARHMENGADVENADRGVIASLEQTGMATASEAIELETELNFVHECPISKGID